MVNSCCPPCCEFYKKSYPLSGDCLFVSWSTPAARGEFKKTATPYQETVSLSYGEFKKKFLPPIWRLFPCLMVNSCCPPSPGHETARGLVVNSKKKSTPYQETVSLSHGQLLLPPLTTRPAHGLVVNSKKNCYPLSGDCLLVSWSAPAAPLTTRPARGLVVNLKKYCYPLSGDCLLVSW